MSRDLKPKRQPPAKKKAKGGTLLGMFIGLVLGVCLAAGVVFYMNRASLPFNPPPVAPASTTKPGAAPLPLPGKPGDPIPEKRFQFYDILPGKSDAAPEPKAAPVESKEKKDNKETKDAAKEEAKPAYLQAGSFASAQEADSQKAKLALMGYEASVLQVMVQDKTFYRVRLGPIKQTAELNRLRSELAKAGIDATLVKKEP